MEHLRGGNSVKITFQIFPKNVIYPNRNWICPFESTPFQKGIGVSENKQVIEVVSLVKKWRKIKRASSRLKEIVDT